MIQRIQTILLSLSALLNGGVYFTPIYERAMEDPQLWIGIGLASATLIAILLTLYGIFLYADRNKQIVWVKRASFIQIVALGFAIGVLFSLGGIGTYLWDEALGTGLLGMALLSQVFALRGIKKDEELVKSMDRIR